MQNHPIKLSVLENVRNKINLVAAVPTYMPLESDMIKSNILYRAKILKKARSASNSVVKKRIATTEEPSDASA